MECGCFGGFECRGRCGSGRNYWFCGIGGFVFVVVVDWVELLYVVVCFGFFGCSIVGVS